MLDIKQFPDPILHQKCADAVPGPELSMLLHAMVETLQGTPNAVGLSAPQVGVAIRAFVMGSEEQGYLAVVNPRVIRRSGIKINSIESCLSVPGVTVTVKRANSITVRAIDAEGNPCEFTCKGRAACIVAHEIDHLDGKTI